jgi:4-amino-4-deoxy-L-arabinose transferase-like glycosyltransferase
MLLCGLRLPWLEADSGNAGFWTYAYFVSDEGEYTAGGRLHHITGSFVDPQLSEPHTLTTSPLMHFTAAIGYKILGLSYGSARLPTMLAAIAAWLAIYWMTSRRAAPWLAFLLVILFSSNPLSLTYERTASSDILCGSLIAISALCLDLSRPRRKEASHGALDAGAEAFTPFQMEHKRSLIRPLLFFFSGIFFALAFSAKLSALAFVPMMLLLLYGVCHHASVQKSLPLLTLFPLGFVLTLLPLRFFVDAVTTPLESAQSGASDSVFSFLSFEPSQWISAMSVFPRWQASSQLGFLLIPLVVLPLFAVFFKPLHRCKNTPIKDRSQGSHDGNGTTLDRSTVSLYDFDRMLLGGVLIFMLLAATQKLGAARYLLPAVFFGPLLLVIVHEKFIGCGLTSPADSAFTNTHPHNPRAGILLYLLLPALLLSFWFPIFIPHGKLSQLNHGEFFIPQSPVWLSNGYWILFWTLALWFVCKSQIRFRSQHGLALFLLAFVGLLFANWNLAVLELHGQPEQQEYLGQQGFVSEQLWHQIRLLLVFLFCLGLLQSTRSWRMYFGFFILLFIADFGLNPTWRKGLKELAGSSKRSSQEARSLEKSLERRSDGKPPVVLGVRAASLLRNTDLRLGFGAYNLRGEKFADWLVDLVLSEGNVYWLVDADWSPQWVDFQEHHKGRLKVERIRELKLPSAAGPFDTPVILHRLSAAKP